MDDAESYEVQQRAGDAVSYSPASCDGEGNVVEETTCTVTDLESGTDYDFRVRGLPADDDDAHLAGAWGTTSGTTTGRGPATTTTTPGGMGELMVRWHNSGTNNATITFVWDRTGDAMYETYILMDADDIHDDNPCENVADVDSADTPSLFEQGLGHLAGCLDSRRHARWRGARCWKRARGLCVREEDSSEASFAWGITPAEEPNKGMIRKSTTMRPSNSLGTTWTSRPTFDYEIHLAADPERPRRRQQDRPDELSGDLPGRAGRVRRRSARSIPSLRTST